MKILSATSGYVRISSIEDNYSPDLGLKGFFGKPLVAKNNVYLVLICVEMGDNVYTSKNMAQRIISQWRSVKDVCDEIVLVPFGHLSSFPHPQKSKVEFLIGKVCRIIRKNGINISCVETNSADCMFARLLIFDNGFSVRFSSTDSGLKPLLREILSVYGANQVLSTLADLVTKKGD